MAKKQPAPQAYVKPDQNKIRGNQIYSILRQKWGALTPEERVRQEYLRVLIEEYAYKPEQIEEEVTVTGRGSGDPRADFLIWRTPEAKRNSAEATRLRLTGYAAVACRHRSRAVAFGVG